MSKPKKSVYLGLETKIAADERGGILDRGRYGDELLKKRAGRQRLPKGLLTDLVVEALRAGLTISEQEIQRRMRFAEIYPTDAHRRHAVRLMGSWHAIVNAGFPPVELDEPDPVVGEMEEVGLSTAAVQEPLFDIPGFKPVLNINGKKRDLAEITIREAVDYRDMCIHMHDNFGRTVAQVSATVEAMLTGAAGDLDANALEAYRRATDADL